MFKNCPIETSNSNPDVWSLKAKPIHPKLYTIPAI